MISDNYVTGDNLYLRELQNFFFETLGMMSVTHYGAIGDGRTDNYGPLQVAIDDANRRGLKYIYVPYGRFIYTGDLINRENIVFVGNPKSHIVNIRTQEEIEIEQFGVNSSIPFNYNDSNNKPKINGVTLYGNKTSADLHIDAPSYVAGDNITITGNTISATDTTYTAGTGIDITDNIISATGGGGSTAPQNIPSEIIVNNRVNLNDLEPGTYFIPEGLEINYGRLSNQNWIYTVQTNTVMTVFNDEYNGNTFVNGLMIDNGYSTEPVLIAGRRGKSVSVVTIGNYLETNLYNTIESISLNGVPQTISGLKNVDIEVPVFTSLRNGLVPKPQPSYVNKFLRCDGNWVTPDNTTYESKPASSGGTDLSLVTTGEKYDWDNKGTYSKPSGGIPATDLDSAVQTSLGKADTAIQDISGKQDVLTAGSNITITNNVISATNTTYTAGANISIDANNEISATNTTYSAGTNITIDSNNQISATDTTYSAGTGISISGTNEISTNAQVNTIESISVNNTAISPDVNKNVDITVPTNNNQLTNGAGYQTASDVTTTLDSKFTYGTTDLTPGTSPLAEGNFYFVYE